VSSYGRRRRSSVDGVDAVIALISGLVVIGFLAFFVVSCGASIHTETVTIHAYAKERGKDKRVYTTDGDGVYTVNDAWTHDVTDSGTTYAQLPVPFAGSDSDPSRTVELTCKVNGIRFSPFSMFKNILSCETPTG